MEANKTNWPAGDKTNCWRHRAKHKFNASFRFGNFQAKITSLKRRKRRTRLKRERELFRRCFELPPKRMQCNLVAVLVIIIFYCSFDSRSSPLGSGSILLTSANELFASQPLPEAQALAYMLHEMGSGDGAHGSSYSRATPHSSGSDQMSSSTTDADVAPALIEARCWNNYENDNDCKQLNVITAPQSERQNQDQHELSTGEDDSLITPVVIFEASSSIDTTLDNEIESERPLFMAPPYQSNEIPQLKTPTRKQHKQHYDEQSTSTSNPSDLYAATPRQPETNFEPPATRPTIIHYVATPQPKGSSDGASRRPQMKVTTQGRKCRDENDADCDDEDEPDNNQIRPPGQNAISHSATSDNDEKDDDDDDENDDDQESDGNKSEPPKQTPQNGANDQTNLINEPGSGLGPSGGATGDDNDDSTDDGDGDSTGDPGESSGSSSIQENSSRAQDNQLLTITSSYPPPESQPDSTDGHVRPTSTANSVPNTRRPPPGGAAEIEVVVHSTLPPSFSINGNGQERSRSKAAYDEFPALTSTTSTTTMIPDEVYTSKPIFPPSTLAPVNPPDEGQQSTSANQAGQTTTELDLYTFKPVPIPVEQSEIRPSRFELGNGGGGNSNGVQQNNEQDHAMGQPKHEVSSQHIHEPPSHRRPFDDGWTTRKPLGSMMNSAKDQLNQQNQSPDTYPSGNLAPVKSYNYMTTETLPTMLLYASIIVTVFISLILVVIYSLWRRNSLRRRALLAKAHMMNGRPPAGMIESMSHVSHLMHGADGLPPQQQQPPPQQGLLSTYARAKGSTIGKVTTSLVKPIDQSAGSLLGQELEEEDEDEDQQAFKDESRDRLAIEEEGSSLEGAQNQQQMQTTRMNEGMTNNGIHNRSGSWSTEDPTTTTSSGSQRTQDSQQPAGNRQQGPPMQNGQRLHHPYPNSLSDGRQNSSSISDSQCSPDPQPSGSFAMNPMQHQPMVMPSNQAHMQNPMHNNHSIDHRELVAASPLHLVGHPQHHQPAYEHYPQQQPQPRQQQPFIRPILRPPPQQHANGLQRMSSMGPVSMSPAGQMSHPMMMQNGDVKGLRQRLVASRSIEDIAPSQHVGFVGNNNIQLPYNQHQQVLPQLIQARPNYQYPNQQMPNMNSNPAIRNSMISPQRIAMSPLATLSRRFPPGAALNRNIYSEDSSSFMTASPSLARTSSSSSFAFNLSNLPTPSSIKAKPIVDPSGRVFNDYTHGLNDHANSNGNGTNAAPTAPPVFGRSDRSEAWYV